MGTLDHHGCDETVTESNVVSMRWIWLTTVTPLLPPRDQERQTEGRSAVR